MNRHFADDDTYSLSNFLQITNLLALSLGILLATTSSRIGSILNSPHLQHIIDVYFLAMLIWGSVTLTFLSWRQSVILFVLPALILIQSFCFLYQPSLLPEVPVQDWLLADTVSSNYSFGQALSYLKNLLTFIVPVFAVNLSRDVPIKWRRFLPLLSLVGGLALNTSVALRQGLFQLEFLASGSGSAVAARRAPALLEDSGASTVYFAMMVSGLFSAAVFTKTSLVYRTINILALVFILIAGSQTSGRTFFVASFLPIIILATLSAFHGLKQQKYRSASYLFGGLLLMVLGLYTLARWKMQDLTVKTFLGSLFASLDLESFNRVLVSLDTVRTVHWRAMAKAFLESPILGTGFGSFYSNLQEHAEWAARFGGQVYADPPGSAYLMLISELGLAGIILVFLTLRQVYSRFKEAVHSKDNFVSSFYLGSALSLAISFLIGSHFLFLSISSLFAISFFFCQFGSEGSSLRITAPYGAVIGLLLLGIGYTVYTAPRPPAFRWLARDKPQVPLSLNVPIAPPSKGNWFESGAEILLLRPYLKFFVEMPPSSYPISIEIKVRDQDGRELAHGAHQIESYTLPKPGRTLSFRLSREIAQKCLKSISTDTFCSVSIQTDPYWRLGREKVGFFIGSNFLDFPSNLSRSKIK